MEKIDEKDEQKIKTQKIMDESDRTIIIYKKYIFNIKIDDEVYAKLYEKNITLCKLREESKNELENYKIKIKIKKKDF